MVATNSGSLFADSAVHVGGGIALDIITTGYRPPSIVDNGFSDSPLIDAPAGSLASVQLSSTVYTAGNQNCAWFMLVIATDNSVLSGQEAALSLSNALPYRDESWCSFWAPTVDNQAQRGAGVPLTSDKFIVPADGKFKVRYYAIGAARYDQNGDINITATVWKDAPTNPITIVRSTQADYDALTAGEQNDASKLYLISG